MKHLYWPFKSVELNIPVLPHLHWWIVGRHDPQRPSCLFVRLLLIRAHHAIKTTPTSHNIMRALSDWVREMMFLELCLVLSLLVTCIAQSPLLAPLGPLPQAYDQPGSCAMGTEFYHPGNLSCVACELNQQTSSDGKRNLWQSRFAFLQCT